MRLFLLQLISFSLCFTTGGWAPEGNCRTDRVITPYSFVLDVKTLSSLNEGWEINFLSQTEKNLLDRPTSPYVWGIGGISYNIGKTWISGLLLEKDYGHGLDEGGVTRGLSFIQHFIPGLGPLVLVDSMGRDRPIANVKVHERVTMDDFVSQFLMRISKDFLYVVGSLGASDIEIINKFLGQAFESNPDIGEIYIIHNLMHHSELNETEFQIKQDIENAFDAFDHNGVGVWDQDEPQNPDLLKVKHLVFAKEGSPAGLLYNQRSLDFLRSKMTGRAAGRMEFPFKKTVEEITRGIVYSHLFTPAEVEGKLMPTAFNVETTVMDGGVVRKMLNRLVDMVHDYVSLFSNNVMSIISAVFGWTNEDPEDVFEIIMVEDDNDELKSLLKFKKPTEIYYAKLDTRFYVDKYFIPKVDIVKGEKCTVYVIDLPGVSPEAITLGCTTGGDSLFLEGYRSVPSLYQSTAKSKGDIIWNERRFSTFSHSFKAPPMHKCVEPVIHSWNNGVLYVWIPSITGGIRGKAEKCFENPPEKSQL